jgi:hypothetical protein
VLTFEVEVFTIVIGLPRQTEDGYEILGDEHGGVIVIAFSC